ncbi:MAG: hypothetical protein ACK5LG_22085 [Bacteroides thetaiotaomicron]
MSKIKVIAAVVDVSNLTLYKEDGSTVLIPQGDPHLAVIVKEITPIISKGGVAEIDLEFQVDNAGGRIEAVPNPYQSYEEKSGGFASFFKVAKSAVKKFFGVNDDGEKVAPPAEPVECQTIGNPAQDAGDENYALLAGDTKLDSTIAEVMANAIPATDPNFGLSEKEESTHEIIAVIKDGDKSKVIPAAENLETQLRAAVLGDTSEAGMQAFLKRVAAIADTRKHTSDDLLKFVQRADLPLTVNGDIVIYKLLRHSPSMDHPDLPFVDCHTKKVHQGPGALVRMDESLVDPNRRNECSNGLHVARRGYLKHFSGDVCLLGVLRPEDVIAVPHGDPNKVRVCAYHLLVELSKKDFDCVYANRPLGKDSEAATQIARIVGGDYNKPAYIVTIGASHGGDVVIQKTSNEQSEQKDFKADNSVGVVPVTSIPLDDDPKIQAPTLDPKAVAETVTEAKKDAVKEVATKLNQVKERKASKPVKTAECKPKVEPAGDTPRAKIAALLAKGLNAETASQIQAIKKAAKKAYDKLGVDSATEEKIKSLL